MINMLNRPVEDWIPGKVKDLVDECASEIDKFLEELSPLEVDKSNEDFIRPNPQMFVIAK